MLQPRVAWACFYASMGAGRAQTLDVLLNISLCSDSPESYEHAADEAYHASMIRIGQKHGHAGMSAASLLSLCMPKLAVQSNGQWHA